VDADALFNALMEDLLHDGDVDLAMQKAFRWGFEGDDGEKTPGLRDLMQRLRDERQGLTERHPPDDRGNPEELQDSDASAGTAPDNLQFASQMEKMERSLRAVESFDDLQGLDPDLMDAVLTDQEKSWLDQWANMKGTLTGAGLTIEVGDHLELTPRAVRRIGDHALRMIFSSVREGTGGDHEMRKRGRVGTQVETSMDWQFGDPFSLNLPRTIMNSIVREGPGAGVRLLPEDFEVFERESRGSTATVLLIDMSRSMFYNGCWDGAKRAALALDTLMRGQFQRDELEIAGFSERAERLTLTQLPSLEWNEYSHGTNLEDGLRLARDLLRPHKGKTRQIVLITDGEPTAFMEGAEVRFEHPPTDRVFDATLRQVIRCTRERITINTFLLEQSEMMVGFAERLSRVNRGRLIHVDPANLGSYLLRDFLANRFARLR
jgi:uncharacterized protein with von Willebrand factor type A (vWA) domain